MKKLYVDQKPNPAQIGRESLFAARWGIATVAVLIVLKAFAAFASNSGAMLASLTDSMGDIMISMIAYYSISLSLKPADEDHRFGHGKAEGFSALLQGSILIGAAAFITLETLLRLTKPPVFEHHALVIAVSAISIALTFILTTIQSRAIKKTGSLALEADQKHYTSDILINGGVIAAALVNLYNGWVIIDIAIGLSIAAAMAFAGWGISKKAADMLMDREIPEENRQKIIALINANENILGVHDLRTWMSGTNIHISFDVEMNGELSLEKAHSISRDLEYSILKEFPNAEILIHIDPEGDTYDTRHKVHGVHH